MVLEEEQRQLGSTNTATTGGVATGVDQVAFLGNKSLNSSVRSKRDFSVMCEYCRNLGHRKNQCYKLIGYPLGFKFNRFKTAVAASVHSITQDSVNSDQGKIVQDFGKSFLIDDQYKQILNLLAEDKPTLILLKHQLTWQLRS